MAPHLGRLIVAVSSIMWSVNLPSWSMGPLSPPRPRANVGETYAAGVPLHGAMGGRCRPVALRNGRGTRGGSPQRPAAPARTRLQGRLFGAEGRSGCICRTRGTSWTTSLLNGAELTTTSIQRLSLANRSSDNVTRSMRKWRMPSNRGSIITTGKIVRTEFGGNDVCLGRMPKLQVHQLVRELGILGKEPLARVGRLSNDLMHGTRTYNSPFETTRNVWPGAMPLDEVPPPRQVPLTAWRRSDSESRPDNGEVALSRRMPWEPQPAMGRERRQKKSQKYTTSGRPSSRFLPLHQRRRPPPAARRAAFPRQGVTQPTQRPAPLSTEWSNLLTATVAA